MVVQTPKIARSRNRARRRRLPLKLAVIITDKGLYLKSRHGSECPPGTSENAMLCLPKQEGKYTPSVFSRLQHHMWYLFAKKYKASSNYENSDEKQTIVLVPEPTIAFGDIIRTLDALREIPRDAKKPKVKHKIPKSGCQMLFDKKNQTFGFAAPGEISVRDTACMYYKVTLDTGIN